MQSVKRAYSLVQLKRLDTGTRTFSGWATTNAVDRMGDTIDPLGARFENPLALLRGHDSSQPIGTVTFKRPTKDGIEFTAEIPTIQQPGELKDRTDMAWAEVETGIVRAVSIGFRPQKWSFNAAGGVDYEEVEILELSTVPIPANAAAQITSVGKGMDAQTLALIKSFDRRNGRPSERQGRIVRLKDPSSGANQKKPLRLTKREKLEMKIVQESIERQLRRERLGIKTTGVVRLTAEDLRNARRGR